MSLSPITLFLDRDGVINRRKPGNYITSWEEFEFLPGVLAALRILNPIVGRIVVVTNQQGIGKGLMTHEDLQYVHLEMVKAIQASGGRIDKVYYCPELARKIPRCRKPNPGMAEQAKSDFPEINLRRSIIAGDSVSDMAFGNRLGMITARICTRDDEEQNLSSVKIHYSFNSLLGLANFLYTKTQQIE